jgi:sterol desaturase/sphingolipid hydroxylase (fatty acid hydroxylase superfamily)
MTNQVAERQLPRRSARVRPEDTCRMFANDVLERFSRIHPSTVFLVWIPVAVFLLARSAMRHHLSAAAIAAMFLAGVLVWTFAEYVLHRWVFHWTNDTPWGRRVHFLLHGVHHDFPNDKDRLVMPLPTSVPLAIFFFALFELALGSSLGEPCFAGFVVGYLFYDGTHYFVHHFTPRSRWGKFLRRHHMTHHFADHDGGFGVSSPLWDYVFRTLPAKRR